MRTKAIIEQGTDGTYSVYTPDLEMTTIVGSGNTIAEARADFGESVKALLEMYAEENRPLPEELQDITFEYKYDIASFFNYYPINMTRLAQMAGINPSLLRQYKRGQYISQKQMLKIQNAIQAIGREMAECQLC